MRTIWLSLFETLDLQNVNMVGHSTSGGGEVARYLARHGSKAGRESGVVGGAVPPLMRNDEKWKSQGDCRSQSSTRFGAGVANNRPQFYKDLTLPFYGFNRPGAKISEGIREHWWLQGMLGGIKAYHYDCVKGFFGNGLHCGSKED